MKPHSETRWANKFNLSWKSGFGMIFDTRKEALANQIQGCSKTVRVRITELKRERKRK